MRYLAFFLFVLLLGVSPLRAEWSIEAVHALVYIVNEPALGADVDSIKEAYRKIYTGKLDDIYVKELIRKRVISREQYIAGLWDFDLLYPSDRQIYEGVRRDFAAAIEADARDLKSHLIERERARFKSDLESEDVVRLKDFTFVQPRFFELPLSFTNYQRMSEEIAIFPRYDIDARQEAAARIAAQLVPDKVAYDFKSDLVPVTAPEIVQRNLTTYLANEFPVESLTQMAGMAESETGQRYLAMLQADFHDRFVSVENMYKQRLAIMADALHKRLKDRTPILIRPLPLHPIPGAPPKTGVNINIDVNL